MGAHWFQISVTCIIEKIVFREEKNWEGGRGGGKIVILPKSTSPQIPNNKTSKKTHKQTT